MAATALRDCLERGLGPLSRLPDLAEALRRVKLASGLVVTKWMNVRRDLAKACLRAKIPIATPNDLRRTFASWLKQAGNDSLVVAKLLGHSTTRIVELF